MSQEQPFATRGVSTPAEQAFPATLLSAAAFLMANYGDLSNSEAKVIADKLERAADLLRVSVPSEIAPKGQHLAIDFEEACRIMGRLASIISATPKEAFKDWALGPEIPYDMVRVAEAFIAKPRSVFAPSAIPRRHLKVVAAFVAPDTQQWQSSTVNVTEDGSWWRWTGTEWVRDTAPMPEAA